MEYNLPRKVITFQMVTVLVIHNRPARATDPNFRELLRAITTTTIPAAITRAGRRLVQQNQGQSRTLSGISRGAQAEDTTNLNLRNRTLLVAMV